MGVGEEKERKPGSQAWYPCVHLVPPWVVLDLVSRKMCDLEKVP